MSVSTGAAGARTACDAVAAAAPRRLRALAPLVVRPLSQPAPVVARPSTKVAAAGTLPQQQAALRSPPPISFDSSFPRNSVAPPEGVEPTRPPDERKVKLGKTLRILQDRLPTLLLYPLPTEILAPNISLHLFPSTHPHLPTVSGRVAYVAALWTSPIAWNRVPIVGNVKLEVLSERMVDQPRHVTPGSGRPGAFPEQLIVRWRTIGKAKGWGLSFKEADGTVRQTAGEAGGASGGREFTGLFVFEFDKEGRIVSHTIERVEAGGDWIKGVGATFVGLTDWLLGGIRGGGEGSTTPCPAFGSITETRRNR